MYVHKEHPKHDQIIYFQRSHFAIQEQANSGIAKCFDIHVIQRGLESTMTQISVCVNITPA